MIIPNIAEYEETDSQLAKQTILDLHCEVENLQQTLTNIKDYIEHLGDIEDLHQPYQRIYKMVKEALK